MSEKKDKHEAQKRDVFKAALEAVREAAKAVETPQQFQEMYSVLTNVSGYSLIGKPAFADGRPGEFVVTVQYFIVKRGGP